MHEARSLALAHLSNCRSSSSSVATATMRLTYGGGRCCSSGGGARARQPHQIIKIYVLNFMLNLNIIYSIQFQCYTVCSFAFSLLSIIRLHLSSSFFFFFFSSSSPPLSPASLSSLPFFLLFSSLPLSFVYFLFFFSSSFSSPSLFLFSFSLFPSFFSLLFSPFSLFLSFFLPFSFLPSSLFFLFSPFFLLLFSSSSLLALSSSPEPIGAATSKDTERFFFPL